MAPQLPDERVELCPACDKPLGPEGALRADLKQPWRKTVRGRTRRGYKIVGVHYECAAKDQGRRFTQDLFAEPAS